MIKIGDSFTLRWLIFVGPVTYANYLFNSQIYYMNSTVQVIMY